MGKRSIESIYKELSEKHPHLEILDEIHNTRHDVHVRCKLCGYVKKVSLNILLYGDYQCRGCRERRNAEEFIEIVAQSSPNFEVLSDYKNTETKVKCRCRRCHHEFMSRPYPLKAGMDGCTNCGIRGTSKLERYILYFLRDMLGTDQVLSRDRKACGYELDIFIPSANLAIEPGSWYHHQKHIEHDLEKRDACKTQGIKLIFIYDATDRGTSVEGMPTGAISFNKSYIDNPLKLRALIGNIYKDISGKNIPSDYDWKSLERRAIKQEFTQYVYPSGEKEEPIEIKPSSRNGQRKKIADGKKPKSLKHVELENSLEYRFPHLAMLFDEDRNGKTPKEVFAFSKDVYAWKCNQCGAAFESSVTDITDTEKFSCPECGRKHLPSFAEYLIFFCCEDMTAEREVVLLDSSFETGNAITAYLPKYRTGIVLFGKRYQESEHSAADMLNIAKQKDINLFFLFHGIHAPDGFDSLTKEYAELPRLAHKGDFAFLAKSISDFSLKLNDYTNGSTTILSVEDVEFRKKKSSKAARADEAMHGRSLAELPGIVEMWDYKRNGNITPDKVAMTATQSYWYRCENGHEFSMKYDSAHRSVCVECSRRERLDNESAAVLYPVVLDYWDWDNNTVSPYDIFVSTKPEDEYRLVCPICGCKWETQDLRKFVEAKAKCPNCLAKITIRYGFCDEKQVTQLMEENNIPSSEFDIDGFTNYGTEHEPYRYNLYEVYNFIRLYKNLIQPNEIVYFSTLKADMIRKRVKEHAIPAVDFPYLQGKFYDKDNIIEKLIEWNIYNGK